VFCYMYVRQGGGWSCGFSERVFACMHVCEYIFFLNVFVDIDIYVYIYTYIFEGQVGGESLLSVCLYVCM